MYKKIHWRKKWKEVRKEGHKNFILLEIISRCLTYALEEKKKKKNGE